MILLTMILIIAALEIVIIGFVMDRLEIRKIQSGMRTLNKRIKRLERVKWEGCYVQMDSDTDTETQEADGGDISLETNDTLQTTGD